MAEPAGPIRRVRRKPAPPRTARMSLQKKLTVGAVNDRHEQEADRLANSMASSAPPSRTQRPPPTISGVAVQRMPKTSGPEHAEELDAPEKRTSSAASAQRKSSGVSDAGGSVPARLEQSINAMRSGPASQLDASSRSSMEGHLGRDLSGVRIHTGSRADDAATALSARAFTVGNDIFFGSGQYQPSTTAGRRLLAHEVTHTIQQSGGSASAQRVQRVSNRNKPKEPDSTETPGASGMTESTDPPTKWVGDKGVGVDTVTKTVTVPKLLLPKFKGHLKGTEPVDLWHALPTPGQQSITPNESFLLEPRTGRPDDRVAADDWREYAATNWKQSLMTALRKRIDDHSGTGADNEPAAVTKGGAPSYFLSLKSTKTKSATGSVWRGTLEELAVGRDILIPTWSRKSGRQLSGRNKKYHADHIMEYQTGGHLDTDNMWLLQGAYNTRVGSQLQREMEAQITPVLDAARDTLGAARVPATAQAARRKWHVKFLDVGAGKYGRTTGNYWTKREIKHGEHLEHLRALTQDDLEDRGLAFGKDEIPKFHNVFSERSSSYYARFPVENGQLGMPVAPDIFGGFRIHSVMDYQRPDPENSTRLAVISGGLTTKQKGSKRFNFLDKNSQDKVFPVDVRQDPDLWGPAGYLVKTHIDKGLKNLKAELLSPIVLEPVRFEDGGVLVADGRIMATKALLPGLVVPVRYYGGAFLVDFPLNAKQIDMGPIIVVDPTLSLGASGEGLFMQGGAGIIVPHLGSGHIDGRATDSGDVELAGSFDLDLPFLESATVNAKYSLDADELSGSAELQVGKGTLPGVDSGTLTVGMSREAVTVDGALTLTGPLAGSELAVSYDPKTGLLIAANDIQLPVTGLPGVQDAKVSVAVRRNPETGEWAFGGSGKAKLAAPGASGTFMILLDGDVIKMMAMAEVAKGPATGLLVVQASNMPIDEEGNPMPDAPVGPLQVWGKGQASIAFGKILTGTASIEYTRDGRIILVGDIALPPNHKVFDGWEKRRNLLTLATPEFPIWGVQAFGVGVGIFASADTRIGFDASVGPGWLRDAHVTATMDLDKPEEATVAGHAMFEIPASAGLTLDIGARLTGRAAVAYVRGRLGLDGRLGVDASASAMIDVAWNQNDGLLVKSLLKASATPKFEIGANASLTVGIEYLGSKTWGPWRKQLGEFGSGMALELSAPLWWSEAEGLQFDIGDLMPAQPRFEPKAMLDGGLDEVRA